MQDRTCPYCGSIRDKPYARKTKCNDCGEEIFVRSKHDFMYKRHVLTKKEAAGVDMYDALSDQFKIGKSNLLNHQAKMIEQNGKFVDLSDVIWDMSGDGDIIRNALPDNSFIKEVDQGMYRMKVKEDMKYLLEASTIARRNYKALLK